MPETTPVRVLVVDDAEEIRDALTAALSLEGFEVHAAETGGDGIAMARDAAPDLIILDLTLPDLDGLEVCRRLRDFTDAYILMLTGRQDEVDKLVGLSAGADDYMTKPFSPRELVARARAMLRRPRAGAAAPEPDDDRPIRTIGELVLDVLAREVKVEGREVELTRIEFDILDALAARPKVTFTRDQLLESVWGPNWFGDSHVVDVHVSKLRRKIEPDPASPRYIRTVRGVGYRLGPGE